jgi:hypothetical protein
MPLVKKSVRRYKRATANRVLADVIRRIQAVNEDDRYAFRVKGVRLFGSMLTDASQVGDIDLAVKLVPRYDDWERQNALCWSRRESKHFSSLEDKGYWPYVEVLRAVKSRSPLVSLHAWDAPERLGTVSRVLDIT